MSVVSFPKDGLFTYAEFKEFARSNFPHCVVLKPDFSKYLETGVDTVSLFGPARYSYNILATEKSIMLWFPTENPYYSEDGTWFFVQKEFWFKNADDALLFKLRQE